MRKLRFCKKCGQAFYATGHKKFCPKHEYYQARNKRRADPRMLTRKKRAI